MLVGICVIMVKCYTAPRYVHLIWNINIWKVPKCWCCHFQHLWLVKVKVTLQSFVHYYQEASISRHILQLFNNGAHMKLYHYFQVQIKFIIVWTPPFLLGGIEPPTKFWKRGGLHRISVFKGALLGTMTKKVY